MNCEYSTCDMWYRFCNKKGYQYPCIGQGILWDINTHARVRVQNSSKVIHVNMRVIPTYIWHMMILHQRTNERFLEIILGMKIFYYNNNVHEIKKHKSYCYTFYCLTSMSETFTDQGYILSLSNSLKILILCMKKTLPSKLLHPQVRTKFPLKLLHPQAKTKVIPKLLRTQVQTKVPFPKYIYYHKE